LHPSLKPTDQKALGKGLPASPGAVAGRIAFDPESAVQISRTGERVILVRRETSPEDIVGMSAAVGILTATGGMTSHAAVVGRGMGKACVVGCTALKVNQEESYAELGGHRLNANDLVTINGTTGEIFEGELPTQAVSWTKQAQKFFAWADELSEMKVLANADTPEQASLARELGAKGIGLCRTEHMFFDSLRLRHFREMILAEEEEHRNRLAEKLQEHQSSDFRGILEAMKGLSVCVRLLDPPLHEFLPKAKDETEVNEIAEELQVKPNYLLERIAQLEEINPMLGHRGCRLGITRPEIYEMQVKALAQAMKENFKKGIKTYLKIMLPLVSEAKELKYLMTPLKICFEKSLSDLDSKLKKQILAHLKWGTMIELPRACLVADEIAEDVDFFSFGTNDLTQTSFGLSRDDSNKFLPDYFEKEILSRDPFESLDQKGVGQLIALALKKGRSVKPKLDISVCGEHGGDPESIQFFQTQGFDVVSCSPFRVPIARLASARAALDLKKTKRRRTSKRKSK